MHVRTHGQPENKMPSAIHRLRRHVITIYVHVLYRATRLLSNLLYYMYVVGE